MKYKTNIKDLADLNPDYIGFIFYKNSKRYVGEHFEMPDIKKPINKVGVFVNEELTEILRKIHYYKLDMVQLHGNEPAEFCRIISRYIPVIKAFGITPDFNFSILKEFTSACEYFLFDTYTHSYGGSGISFDKQQLLSQCINKPFFISGGIDSKEALSSKEHKHIYAIDVNSCFEIKPGMKDIKKLKKLMYEIRN